MATVLVVANETVGGEALIEAVRRRAERGDAEFVVIAPQNQPKQGYVVYEDSALDAARHRVDTTIQRLRELGIPARGDVFDPDPFHATEDAVAEYGADEIIISTHPEARSGWLRRGLVSRIEGLGLPVEHVVVDLDAERRRATHVLVVANHTLGGEKLFEVLERRARETPHRFIIVVPPRGGEGSHIKHARQRLDAMLERLGAADVDATGAVGDADPYTAVMNALQFYVVNEIIISTHPKAKSGWMRADLVGRVRRSTSLPVEHIVVDLEAEKSAPKTEATSAS
jgi:hypothetical protein